MIAAKPTTMICTLGGQPQGVTFALDALLADGVPITECLVLYFAADNVVADNQRIKNPLNKLTSEFVNGRYRERPLSFQLYPIHAPPGVDFRLIRAPVMPWGSYFPALRQLARPTVVERDVLAAPRAALDYAEEARKTAVLRRLTERQTEVLFAFADGLNPQQVAERLFISIKTVDTHKTVILAECRNAWNLPDEEWLDYRFLADKFEAVQELSPTRPNYSPATG